MFCIEKSSEVLDEVKSLFLFSKQTSQHLESTCPADIPTSWLDINTKPEIVIARAANAAQGILDGSWNDNHYARCSSA